MKLKTKIHLFSTLLMLIILSLTNIGIYFVFEKMAYDTEYNQLQLRSTELAKSFSKVNEKTDIRTVISAYMPPNGAIRFINGAGEKIGGLDTVGEIKFYKPQFKQDDRYSIEKFEGVPVLSLRMPVIWTNGEVVELQMIQELIDVKGSLRTLTVILIGVTIIAMIPILISSIALGRILTHPIEKLIETMSQSRKAGTYEKINIPSNGKDEMGQMATTFNDLMSQLETNFNQQEQFVSNASHELRTPLTVIESYARLLTRRGFDNRDVAEEAVGAILSESVRMK
jgi:two-component system, OmpR family, sensor histidine kinase ArlS